MQSAQVWQNKYFGIADKTQECEEWRKVTLTFNMLSFSSYIILWEEGLGGSLCCETQFLHYDSKKGSVLVINFKDWVYWCVSVHMQDWVFCKCRWDNWCAKLPLRNTFQCPWGPFICRKSLSSWHRQFSRRRRGAGLMASWYLLCRKGSALHSSLCPEIERALGLLVRMVVPVSSDLAWLVGGRLNAFFLLLLYLPVAQYM